MEGGELQNGKGNMPKKGSKKKKGISIAVYVLMVVLLTGIIFFLYPDQFTRLVDGLTGLVLEPNQIFVILLFLLLIVAVVYVLGETEKV